MTTTMPDLSSLLDQHALLTQQLVDAYTDRGESLSMAVTMRSQKLRESYEAGLNITTCRELATDASARFDAEALKLHAVVDGLRAQLAHLDHRIVAARQLQKK